MRGTMFFILLVLASLKTWPACPLLRALCPEGQVYQECGSICHGTCFEPIVFDCMARCIAQCFCEKEGEVFLDGRTEKCVPLDECPNLSKMMISITKPLVQTLPFWQSTGTSDILSILRMNETDIFRPSSDYNIWEQSIDTTTTQPIDTTTIQPIDTTTTQPIDTTTTQPIDTTTTQPIATTTTTTMRGATPGTDTYSNMKPAPKPGVDLGIGVGFVKEVPIGDGLIQGLFKWPKKATYQEPCPVCPPCSGVGLLKAATDFWMMIIAIIIFILRFI